MKRNNDSELETAGWNKVYEGGGAHLERVRKEYEELGFETRLEPLIPSECGECTICYEDGGEQLYRIYVRKLEDNLWL